MQLRFNVRGPLLLCSSRRSIALLKEVRHGHPRGCCTQAGRLQSKRISDRAQDACFIVRAVEVGGITGRGLVRQLAPRADHHGFDLTAAALPNRRGSTAGSASLVVLIKGDNQQAVAPRLKIAARQEWADFGLQPGVERADRAVMGVIAAVRRQPGKIRQRIIGQVRGELAEANKIRRVNVRKVLKCF